MDNTPVPPKALNLTLADQTVRPGAVATLLLQVVLPPQSSAIKIFLRLSRQLGVSRSSFSVFGKGTTSALDQHYPGTAKYLRETRKIDGNKFTGHSDDETDWGADNNHGNLVAWVPERSRWKEDNNLPPAPSDGVIILQWQISLTVANSVELGQALKCNLSVLTEGLNTPQTSADTLTVGMHQDAQDPLDFQIVPTTILSISEQIVVKGLSTHPLADVKKQFPSLQFFYSYEGGAKFPISQERRPPEGKSFALQLPAHAFPGTTESSADLPRGVQIYENVVITAQYVDNTGKPHPHASAPLTILIDNRVPAFSVEPHVSALPAPDYTRYHIQGIVEGPTDVRFNDPLTTLTNPIDKLTISWDGTSTSALTLCPVGGSTNHWSFESEVPRDNILGTLNPTITAHTKAGAEKMRHLIFPSVYGLLDVKCTISGDTGATQFQWPGHGEGRKPVPIHSVENLEADIAIKALVGIERLNMRVMLKPLGNDAAPIQRDDSKKISTTPVLENELEKRLLAAWDGDFNNQILALSEFRKKSSMSVKIPLKVIHNAPSGKYQLELVLEDPLTSQPTFVKQEFVVEFKIK